MGIRFHCPNGHKLNVKSFLAGKRGICPECEVRFIIPMESGGTVQPVEEEESGVPEAAASQVAVAAASIQTAPSTLVHDANDVWHLRTATGEQAGPLSFEGLQGWIAEGKVDRDTWVWKSGWVDWQRASDVLPQFGAVPGASSPPPPVVTEPATSADELAVAAPFPEVMPQEPEAVATYRRVNRQRKQRAKSVTLALVALICLLTCVLAIVLWKQR